MLVTPLSIKSTTPLFFLMENPKCVFLYLLKNVPCALCKNPFPQYLVNIQKLKMHNRERRKREGEKQEVRIFTYQTHRSDTALALNDYEVMQVTHTESDSKIFQGTLSMTFGWCAHLQ